MYTLQQLQAGLGRAWEHLAEGWSRLRERANEALTRFQPIHRGGDLQTREDQLTEQAPRWGLLTAEVRETEDEVLVKLEAPGMEPEDFELQVTNDVLVVRGEKRLEREDTGGNFHIMECAYGAFERAIPLPAPVDETKAKAKYRRGTLNIRIPKSPSARKRRIKVEAH
jgi:HSP20 family protein